ncbi:aminoglycoside adenylyltransferase domain-containing protein [Kribbella sp. NPDC020789]
MHPRGRAQSWGDCDSDIREYVADAVRAAGLAGAWVYVHGSLAMGCFYRAKSDVDLLVVVPEALTPAERERVARGFAGTAAARPVLGDLEVSVLTAAQAATHEHPRPFEVHYSAMWTDAILEGRVDYERTGADPDLAAHLTVVRQRGVAVSGPPPTEVFAPVPYDDFLSAVMADLQDVLEGTTLLESPYYGVLNACRVLATQRPGTVLSKEEGAVWAREHLPAEHQSIIEQALSCYRSATPVSAAERATDGHPWDTAALLAFRDWVRTQV